MDKIENMKNNIIKYLGVVLLFAITVSSCRKDSFEGEETLNSGTTFFKIPSGSEVSLFFDEFQDVQTVEMFDISREAANNADLQTSVRLKISQDASIIDEYNTEHGEDFVELPSNFFTFSGTSGFVKTATGYDVNFAAGDFAQNFKINLDGAKWLDKNQRYALAFRVTDWGGVKKTAATEETVMVFFNIKNDYDGKYASVAGQVQRYSAPGSPTSGDALNGSMAGNDEVTMVSLGRTKVSISGLKWAANGGGIGGIDGLQASIDPLTNLVTLSATGNATLRNIPGEVNIYDPVTKTFTLNFDWNQTSTMRSVKGLVLKYSKSR